MGSRGFGLIVDHFIVEDVRSSSGISHVSGLNRLRKNADIFVCVSLYGLFFLIVGLF